jgi:hypothetical protein
MSSFATCFYGEFSLALTTVNQGGRVASLTSPIDLNAKISQISQGKRSHTIKLELW